MLINQAHAEETSTPDQENQETSEETGESDNEDPEEDGKPLKPILTTKDWHDLERPIASAEQTRTKLLLKEIDKRELLELSADDEAFIGLLAENNTAQALGAVLILHDEGLHPDNNQFIAPLRKTLPDHGWNTLAIEIPDPDVTPLPDRKWPSLPADFTLNPPEESDEDNPSEEDAEGESTEEAMPEVEASSDTTENQTTAEETPKEIEASDTSNEEGNEEETKSAQERTMARIEAAIAELKNRGQLNLVLVGQGIGASWAVSYLESSGNQEMFTLVMVDPKLPAIEDDLDYINKRISEFGDLPILDIVSQHTHLAKQQAKERKNQARRKSLRAYQQLQTKPVLMPSENHHRIVKRVRGWLTQNAPGEEQQLR